MAFRITQGDTSPSLLSTLTDGGEAVDITGFEKVRFIMENRFKETVIDEDTSGSVNVIDASRGRVEFIFEDPQTQTAGPYKAEFEVTYDAQSGFATETFPTGTKIDVIIEEEIA